MGHFCNVLVDTQKLILQKNLVESLFLELFKKCIGMILSDVVSGYDVVGWVGVVLDNIIEWLGLGEISKAT